MCKKVVLLILSVIAAGILGACSNDKDPSTPSGSLAGPGLDAPKLSTPSPDRVSGDNPRAPEFEMGAIELDPTGDSVIGVFALGDKPVRGIEVSIDDEIADVTDKAGQFEIPAIRDGAHEIAFGIEGTVFHKQRYQPKERFAQDVPQPEPGPGAMTGTVSDENGPVPEALVIVVQGGNYSFAFTNPFGEYYLTGAPAGNSLAVVVAEFHKAGVAAVDIPPDGTPLEKDFLISLDMTLGRTIGRVGSPGIGPIAGAYVRYEQPNTVREDLSNIFGVFDLPAVPVGNGQFNCVKDGFYPVGYEYEVHAGLNPLPVPMCVIEQSTVHGYVVNDGGEPLDGALVRLVIFQGDDQNPAIWGALSGPQGYFHFEDLLPGSFILQAFMPGMIPATTLGTVLPGSLTEKTLVLTPGSGGMAKGWVVDWMGEPVVGAIVQLRYIGTDINLPVVTGENGYWQLEDVPYGACEVHVESSWLLPGTSWCDIYPDDPGEAITMCYPVLDSATGVLVGNVISSDGSPVPFALVWVFNVLDFGKYSHMTLANEVGEFVFPAIASGTTAGWAFADGYKPDDAYAEVPVDDAAYIQFILTPL